MFSNSLDQSQILFEPIGYWELQLPIDDFLEIQMYFNVTSITDRTRVCRFANIIIINFVLRVYK